jgi:hypothetical protein
VALLLLVAGVPLAADERDDRAKALAEAKTRLKSIYESGDFVAKTFSGKWLSDSTGYMLLEIQNRNSCGTNWKAGNARRDRSRPSRYARNAGSLDPSAVFSNAGSEQGFGEFVFPRGRSDPLSAGCEPRRVQSRRQKHERAHQGRKSRDTINCSLKMLSVTTKIQSHGDLPRVVTSSSRRVSPVRSPHR